MRVLVLGGTVFLSRHVAEAFLTRGHEVTCLTRHPDARVPLGAHGVAGDRADGEAAYDEVAGPWDCVLDVASDPVFVREALRAVAPGTHHWTYVSSCSVYADQDEPDRDESAPILGALDVGVTSTPENYGASKAACELACRATLDDRLLVVRPGLIVGPGDPSDRGGYWPARFVRDREPVLVPTGHDLFAQVIDVRDLAEWIVTSVEASRTGTYNAVGESLPLSQLLAEVRRLSGHEGDVVTVPDQWLLDHGVAPWAGEESLPLWIPRGLGFDGFSRRSGAVATRAGLRARPLAETVPDIAENELSLGVARARRAGLSRERESALIGEFIAHW